MSVRLCVSVGATHSIHTNTHLACADPLPPPASKANLRVVQRKTWHRSLHSITWSHDSPSHTRKLTHSYTQSRAGEGGGGGRGGGRGGRSPLCIKAQSQQAVHHISIISCRYISSSFFIFYCQKEWGSSHLPQPHHTPPL